MKNKYSTGLIIVGAIGAIAAFASISSCRTIPKGVNAVKPFAAKKYLGTWYEIARLDFSFEKNMNQTTASYSMLNPSTIRVLNRGYDTKKEKWKSSTGKAKFVDGKTTGKLKVSFFGPFYAGYNVVMVDPEYKYALVIGKSTKYMWILSRTKDIPDDIRKSYVAKAKSLGVKTDELIWVKQG